MSEERELYADSLIDEVRERRRKLLEECDYDLRKLFERIQRRQAEHPEKLVNRRKQETER